MKIVEKKLGFTAIEIIVVLAVIVILLGVTVPTIAHFLPSVQLDGSSRALAANLRDAQERAVASQNQYLIRFSPTNAPPKYELIKIQDNIETVIKGTLLPSSESMALDESISNSQVVFSPDGGPSSTGSITLTLAGKSKLINVSPAGFIKIQ